MNPASSMSDLKKTITEHFSTVSSKLWTSVFRKVQRFEDDYVYKDAIDIEESEESDVHDFDDEDYSSASGDCDEFLI